MNTSWKINMVALLSLLVLATASPIRRSPDLEARRRSAIDRSMVRFGRSYPAQVSAADVREALLRSTRRADSFVRFGRSRPLNIPSEDLLTLVQSYEDYDNAMPKRESMDFIRLGRDPQFIRLGKSFDSNPQEQTSNLILTGEPQRKLRARDHFLRLGRDSEELNEVNEFGEELEDNRRKRSAEGRCHDCQ